LVLCAVGFGKEVCNVDLDLEIGDSVFCFLVSVPARLGMGAEDLHEVSGGIGSLAADHGVKYGTVGGVVWETGTDFVAESIVCREGERGGHTGDCQFVSLERREDVQRTGCYSLFMGGRWTWID
jgi:hypothetical protein